MPAILLLGLLSCSAAALGQNAPAGGSDPQAPEAAPPAEPTSPLTPPDTMAPPRSSSEDDLTPGALSLRSQFEAAMTTVDSSFSRLMPVVPVAAVDLKRLAFARLASEPKAAAEQRRVLELRTRELTVANERLRSIDRVLERWRSTMQKSGSGSATMISALRRRSSTAAALHRQIDCGRYFAHSTARAMRAGSPSARPQIPAGC